MMTTATWRTVGAVDPLALVEARNQAHHALQLHAMAAIAFVPFRSDLNRAMLAVSNPTFTPIPGLVASAQRLFQSWQV